MFSFFLQILGVKGIIAFIGLITFLFFFYYSQSVFNWVESRTLGTREHLMEKLELLFVEIAPERVFYLILLISFGLSSLVFALFALGGLWFVGIIAFVGAVFLGFRIPIWVVDFFVARRIKHYQNQMVDALTLLANGIRAGLSVPQALGMVVEEMPAPISQEFNLLLQQNRIGVPLEECFENLAKRVPLEDNDMFVSSINILRESGGNLAEVFDTIVGVIRERVRLQQKIDTFTAQGMFQGATIFSMPFVMAVIYAVNDPASIKPLFTTPLGIIAVLVALALDLVGGFVILKIVRIKI